MHMQLYMHIHARVPSADTEKGRERERGALESTGKHGLSREAGGQGPGGAQGRGRGTGKDRARSALHTRPLRPDATPGPRHRLLSFNTGKDGSLLSKPPLHEGGRDARGRRGVIA